MSRFHFKSGDRPLDGYTIEYALGRGGFGEVYYAVSDAGRQVALKAVQNYEEIELRGISHCMNLKSQHLVSIFDVKHGQDGMPWVIMEYVAGPSLRDILDDSPGGIGAEKATFFINELAKGIGYLHGAGVVHRDLKPHNVFFEEGVVKIGDYSLSKAITSSHRSGHTMTVGTVHYMAPEIGMGRYDKTVDIYALGVMLFEMLTGEPPYTGDSMGEVLMKHLSSRPDLTGIEEPFATVIEKAMRRDPAERFATAEALAAAVVGNDVSQPASLPGFGPASLSMVAQRGAGPAYRRNPGHRPSEDSTGRVDASLTTTQRDGEANESEPMHPMRILGRDLRMIANHAGIVTDRAKLRRGSRGADPIAAPWRFLLSVITLAAITVAGTLLARTVGSTETRPLVVGVLGPFVQQNDDWLDTNSDFYRVLVPAVAIVAGALLTRLLVLRGILPLGAKRCRLVHVTFSFATLIVLMVFHVSPVETFQLSALFALAFPLVVQGWVWLTLPTRPARIRLAPVLFAASFAFMAAELLGAPSIAVATSAIASALALQIGCRFPNTPDEKSDSQLAVTMQAAEPEASRSPSHSLVVAE